MYRMVTPLLLPVLILYTQILSIVKATFAPWAGGLPEEEAGGVERKFGGIENSVWVWACINLNMYCELFVCYTVYRDRSPCRVTSSACDVIAVWSRDTMQNSYQTRGCCSDVTSSCVKADFYYPSTTTDDDVLSSSSFSYSTELLPASAGDHGDEWWL